MSFWISRWTLHRDAKRSACASPAKASGIIAPSCAIAASASLCRRRIARLVAPQGPGANFQPAILIQVGDGSTTEFEVPAPTEAGSGVLLDGNGDIVRTR